MAVEWKDETATDLSGGVTDLVTASGPEFQELCNNLGHNPKVQLLSTREGYRRFTSAVTPAAIEQLFKLEDWLIAFCADGNLYYRLETDTISAWTVVDTPKARTATLFRIYNSEGKGFTLRTASPGTIYDQFLVKEENLGSGQPPTVTVSGRTISLVLNSFYPRSADNKWNPGSGNITFNGISGLFGITGWTFTLLTGTLTTDEIVFDELLTVQEVASPYLGVYPVNARSDGDSTALGFTGEDGHLQPSEWQSHLYLALEPYIKTFAANPSDPNGEDPEAFPPTNQRMALRKVVPFAPAIGASSSATVLKAANAQLPKTYIGVETSEPTTYSDAMAHYRYQVYTVQIDYVAPNHAGDVAEIEIWCERTWGYQGATGTMGTHQSFLVHRNTTTANPLAGTAIYSLADPTLGALSPWSVPIFPTWIIGGTPPTWGFLCLFFHSNTGTQKTLQEVVEGIDAAFAEYQVRAYNSGGIKTADYGNFGYYLKVNPKARMNALVDANVPGHDITVRYADSLPENVAGNHRYGYGLYLRDNYKAMVEGSPRDFITDGPVAFLQVRTLSPISDDLRRGSSDAAGTDPYTYTAAPRIFGGISTTINRTSSLYYQSGLEAVIARTTDGGETYYIEEGKKYWYRTGDASPLIPTIGSNEMVPSALLTGEDWTNRTSYIIAHEPTITDDLLQYEEGAYFNGGILGYDAVPQGPFYFDINTNQTGVYGHIVGNIQRVYVTPPGAPYASPATMFEDFDDELSGVTHYLDKSIVTTTTKLWRIEGAKGADGSGRTFLRTVSEVYGCIANQSIVRTDMGLFLWSKSGIIWTDGIKAFRVTEHLIGRYQQWVNDLTGGARVIGPEKLRGAYDALDKKIRWSLIDADGKPFFVVLSLQKGVNPTMPVVTEDGIRFQSVDSLGDVTNIDYFQTHATVYSDDRQAWYRGQGTYLMVRDEAMTYDESHVTGLKHPILPYFKSIAYAYGIPWARKRTSKIQLNLRDTTRNGVSLTPLGWNDLSETPHKLGNCLNYQHMNLSLDYATATPLDLQQFFRHTDCKWNSHMIVTYKRRFGRGQQRNCFKQVGFQALRLKYGEISKDTAGITNIQLIHKAPDLPGAGDHPQATSYIEISTAGTAVSDLLLDASGQFYVTWDDVMEPVAISDYTDGGTLHRIKVLPGGSNPTITADHVENWPTIKFYRAFTDQKIDLLGYNLTYRLIGDRTQGALKSPDKGGVDA